VRLELTGRGVMTAITAPVLIAAGEWFGYPLLRSIGAVMLVAIVVTVGLALRPLRLEVRRGVGRLSVHRGNTVEVRLQVTNMGRFRQPAFGALDAAEGEGVPLVVPALDPRDTKRLSYLLPARRRGRQKVGPLRVERLDPLGLTRRRRSAGGWGELWVYPRLHGMRTLPDGPPRRHFDGPVVSASLRGSSELRALREYVPGDEPRHIHWKVTATTGIIMVRDLVDPSEPQLMVLLDNRSGIMSAQRFEDAAEIAASLLTAAAVQGHRTRLATTLGLSVQPQPGLGGMATHLDALCEVSQGDPPSAVTPKSLTDKVDRGALVFVTCLRDNDISWLARRSRHSACVVFDLDDSDRAAPAPPGVAVVRAPDAATAVSRWNAMNAMNAAVVRS